MTRIKQDFQQQRKGSKMQQQKPAVNLSMGYVPPQDIEAEMAVLGILLMESVQIFEIAGILKDAEYFYKTEHQKIFKAITEMHKQGYLIDPLTVADYLKKMNALELVGGMYYLTQLMKDVVSSAHVQVWAKIVAEKYMKREIIRIGGEMITTGYDDAEDIFDSLNFSIKELQSLSESTISNMPSSIGEVYQEVMENQEELRHAEDDITGIPTGYKDLDEALNGLKGGHITVVAGRPGTGKTAFCLNVAYHAEASSSCGFVLIFSMEMKKRELVQRIMSKVTGVKYDAIMKPKRLSGEDQKSIFNSIKEVGKKKIFIDDTASISTSEMRAKARALTLKFGKGLVIIDYLQLTGGDKIRNFNREQEISQISREIKTMSMDLDIPIIELSQMSRDIEKRGGEQRPRLSDLRESGAIEQDASEVLFLYRPTEEDVKQDATLAGLVEVVIAKSRSGKLENIPLTWDGSTQRFGDLSESNTTQQTFQHPAADHQTMQNSFRRISSQESNEYFKDENPF